MDIKRKVRSEAAMLMEVKEEDQWMDLISDSESIVLMIAERLMARFGQIQSESKMEDVEIYHGRKRLGNGVIYELLADFVFPYNRMSLFGTFEEAENRKQLMRGGGLGSETIESFGSRLTLRIYLFRSMRDGLKNLRVKPTLQCLAVNMVEWNPLSWIYKDCVLHSIATRFGSIAAQDRKSPNEKTGFAFVGCRVTGTGPIYVGRAMGPYSRIVYAYTYFDDIVTHAGWDNWNHDQSKNKTIFFGVYKCWGPGATSLRGISWAPELDFKLAHPFLAKSFVNGRHWLPFLLCLA